MRDCGLHADTHETVRVIHWLPHVNGKLAASVIRVAVILHIQFCAVIGENLNDIGTSLVCGTMESDAA